MKALVLGATGLIGNSILRELIASGYSVTGTSRKGTTRNIDGLEMRIAHGDIDAPGQLDEWISGKDIVVDAAAPYPLHLVHATHGSARPTLKYAADRTDALIKSCIQHGTRLVYIGTTMSRPERAGFGPAGMQRRLMRIMHPYFAMKSAIERRLLAARERLPGLMIVQPSACVGPFDVKPRDQCLVPNLVNGRLSIAANHKLNLIDTRDVARAVVAAIEADRFGETIRLTGHNTTVSDTLTRLGKITDTSTPRINVPAALGVLPTFWAEFAWGFAGRPSPLPSLLPILICEQGWSRPSDAQRSLGLVPRPTDETLRDTVSWYRELGYC